MSTYLPEAEARALVEELADFRVGATDLTSLHTVRDLRTWTEGGHELVAFVLGNTGGVSGGTGGPAGTETAVCLCRGLSPRPHVVVEPDGWLARLRGLFARERVLARRDGVRVVSREPEEAAEAWAVEELLALGAGHPGLGVEVVGERVVAWGEGGTSVRLLVESVLVAGLIPPPGVGCIGWRRTPS